MPTQRRVIVAVTAAVAVLLLALVGVVLLNRGGEAPQEAAPPAASSAPAPSTEPTGQPGGGGGGGVAPSAIAPSAIAPSAIAPSTTPSGAGSATVKPWTTGPVIVTRDVPVPPVPVLTGIRSAAHQREGYDRIVFDFSGPLPGFDIRYVDRVTADPSDLPVDVPGRRFLRIVFTPAQAHTGTGQSTVAQRVRFDHPMLRGYALAGDFEAVLTIGVGVDDVVGFRVGQLPGRIYLDVAA